MLISTALNIVFELDRQKVKNLTEKENTIVLREIQGFGLPFTSPVCFLLTSLCNVPRNESLELATIHSAFFQIFMCLKHGLSY